MIAFEITNNINIFSRVWNEIYLLLFFNIGLALGNFSFFSKNYLIIELFIVALFLYSLFNKRNRHVYKLLLIDNDKTLAVFYYQFIFFRFRQIINYKNLQINYKHKLYGRGKIPKTLEIRKNNKLITEIKQKYNLGWKDEELDNIYETLMKKLHYE